MKNNTQENSNYINGTPSQIVQNKTLPISFVLFHQDRRNKKGTFQKT